MSELDLGGVPLATSGLPGTGGEIRAVPEDFTVEEIPAYEPTGEGDHAFLWIEKRDLTTREAVRKIASILGVQERDVGVAGLKDRHALTRQYLSVLAQGDVLRRLSRLDELPEEGGLRVLRRSFHANKLKTGHLKGNRFSIRIRGTIPDALSRAEAIASWISAHGLPNAYGVQRFGRDGLNAVYGRQLVRGEVTPATRKLSRDRFLRRLSISAYQSLLFNRVLTRRMADGLFEEAVAGDLMKKRETGGLFISSDAQADSLRVKAFEISQTGPIFGHKMMLPEGEAWARESSILAEEGITLESFRHLKGDGEGSRRPLRIRVAPQVMAESDGSILLTFELPKGAFATVLLREIMKADALSVPDQLDEG